MSASSNSSLPTSQPVAAAFTSVAGPLIFGSLVNWTLFGVLSLQVYIYTRSFASDRRWIKGIVYFVFALEIAQTSLNGADVYYWFVSGYGDLTRLQDTYLSVIDVPVFVSIISIIVHLFYCYRIYTIRKSLMLAAVFIAVVSLLQGIVEFYNSILGIKQSQFSEVQHIRTQIFIGIWLFGLAISDTCITLSMIYILYKNRRAEYGYSNDILSKITRLTIESNLATTCVSFIAIGFVYGKYKHTEYFYAPTAILGKLYSNTLLTSLNNRINFRESRQTGGSGAPTQTVSQIVWRNPTNGTDSTNGTTSEQGSSQDVEMSKRVAFDSEV